MHIRYLFLLLWILPGPLAYGSGVLKKSEGPGSLGSLEGWAAFGLVEHPGLIWVSKNAATADAATLIDHIHEFPRLLRLSLTIGPEVTESPFDNSDDFESGAEQGCALRTSKEFLKLQAGPLFPHLGQAAIEESAVTVIKVIPSQNKTSLQLESSPVRCADPKGTRLKKLLTRSSLMLVYAATAHLTDKARDNAADKKEAALLQIVLLRQALAVLSAREPWVAKDSKEFLINLQRGKEGLTRRLNKVEGRFLKDNPSKKDAEALAARKALDQADWKKLGIP